MTSPQKAKGGSFEREIAQFLSNLYGESFIRAPGSGAYVGGSNKARKEVLHEGQVRSFKGDIVPGQNFGKLNAECKSYKDFAFHQIFHGTIKQLDQWITQCMEVADEGDFNIIFMKFNRKGKFIAFQNRHQVEFNLGTYITYNSGQHGTWIFMALDNFFQNNQEQFRQACKS